jgi:hypothetical protein
MGANADGGLTMARTRKRAGAEAKGVKRPGTPEEPKPGGEAKWALVEAGSKPVEDAKRVGTLVRVTHEFAQALKDAASFEKLTMAQYATAHLLPVVRERHKAAVIREARRMEGGGQ